MFFDFSFLANFQPEISSIRVINNNLWAITRERNLIYANFNDIKNPQIRLVDGASQVLFIFVSPDGRYCLYTNPEQTAYTEVDDLTSHQIPILPGYQVTNTEWQINEEKNEVLLFMTTNGQVVFFVNLRRKIKSVNMITLPVVQKLNSLYPIGIKILNLDDNLNGILLIAKTHIVPYFLDSAWVCDQRLSKKTIIIPALKKTNVEPISTYGNTIGVWINDSTVLAIELNSKASSIDDMMRKQFLYTVPEDTVWFYIMDGFLYTLSKSNKLHLYFIDVDDAITEISTLDVEYSPCPYLDPVTNIFYTLHEKGVYRYTFPNTNGTKESFIFDVYRKSFSLHNTRLSTYLSLLCKIPMYKYFSHLTDEQKVSAIDYIFEKIGDKINTKQKKNLALLQLEYCVRSCTRNTDASQFESTILRLFQEKLVKQDSFMSLAKIYGMKSIVNIISKADYQIEIVYESGNTKESLDLLEKIQSTDVFIKYATKLSCFSPKKVLEIVMRKITDFSNPAFISLFMKFREEGEKILNQLYAGNKITQLWQSHFYMMYALDNNNYSFFTNSTFPEILKWDAIRTLFAQGKNIEASSGLSSLRYYSSAAIAAAKTSLSHSLSIILGVINPKAQLECAKAVLNSLTPNEAGKLSEMLLASHSFNASVALRYLLDDLHIVHITESINNFLAFECFVESETIKNTSIAKRSIRKAQQLLSDKKNYSTTFSSGNLYDNYSAECAKSEFNFYPCGHISSLDSNDQCHICGVKSIMEIDSPLEFKNQSFPLL